MSLAKVVAVVDQPTAKASVNVQCSRADESGEGGVGFGSADRDDASGRGAVELM